MRTHSAGMDVADALAIIDAAAERTSQQAGATPEVVEALHFLSYAGCERAALKRFWSSLLGDNLIGRWQNANASRHRIKWLLSRSMR